MKRFFILVLLLASISISSYAGFWDKVKKVAGQVVSGILYGATDMLVNASGDKQTIDNWNNIKSDIAPSPSYGSDAGSQLVHGDYIGAAISAASAGALEAGVSADIVALGNAGLNNWVNGDKEAAIIDVGQMVTHITGNCQFDYFFDMNREYNQINRELRENLQSGMSKEEAYRIRNEKLANVIVDATEYVQNIDAERKARVIARRNEVKNALLQRGYNNMEADYLSTSLSIEDLNNDNTSWSSVDDMLNDHHIGYRNPHDDNGFFDDVNIEVPEIKDTVPPVCGEEPTPPQINTYALDSIEIANTVIAKYGLNETELSSEQQNELEKVVGFMKKYPESKISIIGHTCSIGDDESNRIVGMRRANEAKQYLVSRGVRYMSIVVESRAANEPCASNDIEDNRQLNRRITFKIN